MLGAFAMHIPRLRRSPEWVLILLTIGVPLSFATWQALLNNFAIESAAFTGREIGILQSLREVPGFLAFTVVFLLLVIREQRLAIVSLAALGLGTALTGLLPSVWGLYFTTVLMSVGFHYLETVKQSLTLQWIPRDKTPQFMGQLLGIASASSLIVFGAIWLCLDLLGIDYFWVYLLGGGASVLLALALWLAFPQFPGQVKQHRHMVLRKRYWLYYALVFMSGARRQIFIVFAGFLMVEKFGYSASDITLLFLANCAINIWLAPKVGRLIAHYGERRALTFEYIGLIGVFAAYAFVENAHIAAGLYIVDHLFFALAIAIKTYFQKIADPADIASTAGVSFTINHIAAVALPAIFGLLWLVSPAAVFLSGAAMAAVSLGLSRLVPGAPEPGLEVCLPARPART
jgi:predicted MFS family arabinose efflux permease